MVCRCYVAIEEEHKYEDRKMLNLRHGDVMVEMRERSILK